MGEQASTGVQIRHERKHDRDAAQIFDRSNISCAQKVGGFFPAPFFSITGVEVWCYADERFHRSANGFRGRRLQGGDSRSRGIGFRDAEKSNGPISAQVIGRDDVRAIHAGRPNTLRRGLVPT